MHNPFNFWKEDKRVLRCGLDDQSREERVQVLKVDLKKLLRVEFTLKNHQLRLRQLNNEETSEKEICLNDIRVLQEFINTPRFQNVKNRIVNELRELSIEDATPPLLQA